MQGGRWNFKRGVGWGISMTEEREKERGGGGKRASTHKRKKRLVPTILVEATFGLLTISTFSWSVLFLINQKKRFLIKEKESFKKLF